MKTAIPTVSRATKLSAVGALNDVTPELVCLALPLLVVLLGLPPVLPALLGLLPELLELPEVVEPVVPSVTPSPGNRLFATLWAIIW